MQSGKTSSIIGTIACAIDQGFKIVVVLTGTKINLNDQNKGRIFDKKRGLAKGMTSGFKAITIKDIESGIKRSRAILGGRKVY